MQEALGLKVSQFSGLVGDDPESAEDRALSTQASTSHMQRVLAKLRNSGREKPSISKRKRVWFDYIKATRVLCRSFAS